MKNNYLSLLIIAVAMITTTFSNSVTAKNTSTDRNQKAPANHSIWQTKGYGYILELEGDNVRFYDVTQQHCLVNHLESGEYSRDDFTFSKENTVFNWGALHPVELEQLESLPKQCQTQLVKHKTDDGYQYNAQVIFDVFWSTNNELFAFSQQLKWDWQQQYTQWSKKISPQMSEAELAQVFNNIFTELGDAHAYLESAEGRPLAGYNIKWENFKKNTIEHAFRQQEIFKSPYKFHMHLNQLREKATKSLFSKVDNNPTLNNSFNLHSLNNNLNYLSIDDMSEYTDDESLSADLTEVDRVMKIVTKQLQSSKGLIIDLRWNSGGYDLVSTRILSYLINQPILIGSKIIKSANGFSQPQEITVNPSSTNTYIGPIVVLTSPLTMSAAELFVLGLAARDNVLIIGESSNGGFSDSLIKQLPNGWSFALSSEQYLDTHGINHEYQGYPVKKQFKYLDIKPLEKGEDIALAAAIKQLSL